MRTLSAIRLFSIALFIGVMLSVSSFSARAQSPQFFMVFSNDCKAVAVYSRVAGPWRTSFIFQNAAGQTLATYNASVAGVGISVGVFSVPAPGSYLMRVMRNDVTPQQLIETDTGTCGTTGSRPNGSPRPNAPNDPIAAAALYIENAPIVSDPVTPVDPPASASATISTNIILLLSAMLVSVTGVLAVSHVFTMRTLIMIVHSIRINQQAETSLKALYAAAPAVIQHDIRDVSEAVNEVAGALADATNGSVNVPGKG